MLIIFKAYCMTASLPVESQGKFYWQIVQIGPLLTYSEHSISFFNHYIKNCYQFSSVHFIYNHRPLNRQIPNHLVLENQ